MSEKTNTCPQCGNQDAWKYGTKDASIISYVCKKCACHYSEPWMPPEEGLKCPTCSSQKLWRDGSRYTIFNEKIQRWLCKDCGYRFSQGLVSMKEVQRSTIFIRHVEHPGIVCPKCGCQRVWKDGSYYPPLEEEIKVQRYLCTECQHRFSKREPNTP